MENYKRYLGKKIGHLIDEKPQRLHYTDEQLEEWLDYERICCRKTMYNIRKGKTSPSDGLLDMICRKIGVPFTDDETVYAKLYEMAATCKAAIQNRDYSQLVHLRENLDNFKHKEYILCQEYWLVLDGFTEFALNGSINRFQRNEGKFHYRDIFNDDFNDLLDYMSVYRMIINGGKDKELTQLLNNPIFSAADHQIILLSGAEKRLREFYIQRVEKDMDCSEEIRKQFYLSLCRQILNENDAKKNSDTLQISTSRNRKRNMKQLTKNCEGEQLMINLAAILHKAQQGQSYKLVYDYLMAYAQSRSS